MFYAYFPPKGVPGWSVILVRARDGKATEIPADQWYSKLWWIDRETIKLGYGNTTGVNFIEKVIDLGEVIEP